VDLDAPAHEDETSPGFHHHHGKEEAEPESKVASLGMGVLFGAGLLTLGNIQAKESFLKRKLGQTAKAVYRDAQGKVLNTVEKGVDVPAWSKHTVESSSLLKFEPVTILKALGLAGSASLINKGLGLYLSPPLLAMELGAVFHALVPGSVGMKTAHYLTMAPLLGGSAYVANQVHNKINDHVDQNKSMDSNTKTFVKAASGFGVSAATAVGAMALYPRVNLGLVEARMNNSSRGWYLNTAQSIDGVVSAGREAFQNLKGNSPFKGESLGAAMSRGWKLPFLGKNDPTLAALGYDKSYNYYSQNVPSLWNTSGIETQTYQTLRAVRFTDTATQMLKTEMTGKSYTPNPDMPAAFQDAYNRELSHLADDKHREQSLALGEQLSKWSGHNPLTHSMISKVESLIASNQPQVPEVIHSLLALRELAPHANDVLKTVPSHHDITPMKQELEKLVGQRLYAREFDAKTGKEMIGTFIDDPSKRDIILPTLGDFGRMAFYSHEMKNIVERAEGTNPYFSRLAHQNNPTSKTLSALHSNVMDSSQIMKKGSTLKDNFVLLTNALDAVNPINEGRLSKQGKLDVEANLNKAGWSARDVDQFTTALNGYVSRIDHAKNHDPQVTKAWALEAGAGGAVCANGCCAGSVFCWNEAVALIGSTMSTLSHALGISKNPDDDKTKKPPAA